MSEECKVENPDASFVHDVLNEKEKRIIADEDMPDGIREAHLLAIRTGKRVCNGGKNNPAVVAAAIGANTNLTSELGLGAKAQHHRFCAEYIKEKGLEEHLQPKRTTLRINTPIGKFEVPKKDAITWVVISLVVWFLMQKIDMKLNSLQVIESKPVGVASVEK